MSEVTCAGAIAEQIAFPFIEHKEVLYPEHPLEKLRIGAERLGKFVNASPGSWSDICKVVGIFHLLNPEGFVVDAEQCCTRVKALMSRPEVWRAVKIIAEQLFTKGNVTGREIAAICGVSTVELRRRRRAAIAEITAKSKGPV